MTTVRRSPSFSGVDRSVRRYRSLLWLYPAAFREEYGDDLVQSYRDLLLLSADGRASSWRMAGDLLRSAGRERAAAVLPGGRPSWWMVLAAVVALGAIVVAGGLPILLIPAVVFVLLPLYGVAQFRRAWVRRRAVGESVATRVVGGLACFTPAALALAWLGEDAGYWLFVAVGGSAIVSASIGVIWSVTAMVRRPADGARRPWGRIAVVAVPALAVLGFIIVSSINSYRWTVGPDGDHSVENAAPESRRLWVAAGAGDLVEVEQITATTCADPWVRYVADQHGNRENARGHAIVNGHGEVKDHLEEYMGDWSDRCGPDD